MNKNRIIQITILALLFFGVLSIIPSVSASASQLVIENFEAQTTGAVITCGAGCTYNEPTGTGGGGTMRVSTSFSHTGSKSSVINQVSGTGDEPELIVSGSNMCSGTYGFSFWLYFSSLPASGNSYTFITGDARFHFNNDGTFKVHQAALTDTLLSSSYPIGGWIDISVAITDATNGIVKVDSSVLGIHTTIDFANAITCGTGLNHITFAGRDSTANTVPSATLTFFVDDFGTADGYNGLSPVAIFTSSTNIAGIDVARNGGYAILRNGSPSHQHVLILDGLSLTQTADTGDSLCNRLNGVLALSDNGAAYLSCNSTQHPNAITFVNSFGTANYPFACTIPQNYNCDGIISYTAPGPFDTNDNDGLSLMLRGYSGTLTGTGRYTICGNDFNTAYTATNIVFTESSTGSNIVDTNEGWSLDKDPCVNVHTVEHLHPTTQVDTTTSPSTACAWGNGRVFKALPGSPVKGYTITTNDNANSLVDQIPPPVFTQTFVAGSSTGALFTAKKIACSTGNLIATSNDGTQATITDYNGNIIVTKSGLIGANFVAINGNASYAAIEYTSGLIQIVDKNLNQLTFINSPDAEVNHNNLFMDNCAQNLFLTTTTHVYRYNITANTTGSPVSVNQGNCVSSSGITNSNSASSTFGATSNGISFGGSSSTITNPFHASDDNPFGINITYVSHQLHISHEATAVFIGLIFVVIFTIWLWRGTGSPIIAILGAGLGLIVATMFGFINVWVIMVVVLFLIVILGKMIFGGFTGGEES